MVIIYGDPILRVTVVINGRLNKVVELFKNFQYMFCLRLSNITTFHVSMLRHPAKFQFKKTHRPSACSVLLWLCVRFPLSVLDWVCLLSKISFFFVQFRTSRMSNKL